jgi:cell division septation protein DedD
MYEGDEINYEDETLPEESNNRTFMIAAGVLGGLILLTLICGVAIFFLVLKPQQAAQGVQATQEASIQQALTATANAVALQPSPLPSETPTPSPTPVVAQPTNTPLPPTPDPATATVGAALTQAALAAQTVVPTSTALPGTGFADDVGIPGLLVMAVLLVAIILIVRRLRFATTAR